MVRTITLIGLVAALAVPQAVLAATPGAPSGYGTEGPYGQRLHTQAQSTFDRHWNHYNEARWRAASSTRWMRRHGESFPNPF